MSGTLVTISALRESLPAAEQRVADRVLKMPEQVPHLSVQALAKASRVSVASVIRLAKRTGCGSYSRFKINIAQELATPVSLIYEAITAQDSNTEIVRKVFAGNIRGLEDTLKMVRTADLVRAARLISRAGRIAVFGIGSSGNVVRDAAYRFSLLGMNSHAYTDPIEALSRALDLGKKDVAIAISHSGRSVMPIRALYLASAGGTATIGISNYASSPLSKICDSFFCTAFPESAVKAVALSSRVCQTCLIDALYLLTAHAMKDLSHVERVNALTEKHFRESVGRRRRSGKTAKGETSP